MRSDNAPLIKVVEGFAPSLPDIPIYLIRNETEAQRFYRKFRKFRVTVTIEELNEEN